MESQINQEILSKVRQIEIRSRRLVEEAISGHYHSVFKGRGMNFDEVREYVPGDDIRSIDWNVTARMSRPFIKKYVEERELSIVLMIDLSASQEFASIESTKREIAAEIGSILAFSALKNNDKIGLILWTDQIELYIPPKKGRRHVLRIIREILFFTPKTRGTNLSMALDFVNQVIRRHAVVFLIGDFCFSGDFEKELSLTCSKLQITNKRHDLVGISVRDPNEFVLPKLGLINIEDAETGEQVEINTNLDWVIKEFSKLADAQKDLVRKSFRSSGVDLLELETATPYLPALLRFFKIRENRRRRG